MSYFQSFPVINYQFGEADNALTIFQNISAYADIIDKFKNQNQSYLLYDILDGDRPDALSHHIYGNQNYYWTFYLMNDGLRRQGWPLSYNELVAKATEAYPNTTLVFRTDGAGNSHVGHPDESQNLVKIFKIGSKLQGAISGATGTVIRKDLDLGHVIISGATGTFIPGEIIYFNRVSVNPLSFFDPSYAALYADVTVFESSKLKSASLEINSAHHYEDAAGKWVDIDLSLEAQAAFVVEKTHLDALDEENNKLKSLKVLKPSVIAEISRNFSEIMGG